MTLQDVKYQTHTVANEAEIMVPGPFVVLQGLPGDGASNTIDSYPLLPSVDAEEEDEDDYQHLDANVMFSDTRADPTSFLTGATLVPPALSTLSVHPLQMSTSGLSTIPRNDDSFIVVDDDLSIPAAVAATASEPHTTHNLWRSPPLSCSLPSSMQYSRTLSIAERKSIHDWNTKRRTKELQDRKEWLAAQDVTNHPWLRTSRAWMETDTWWLNSEGRLVVLQGIPTRSTSTGVVMREIVASLPPGCTIVGTELICLDASTFRPIKMHTSSNNGIVECPRGRAGWLQLLKIVSPCEGWVVLSIDGLAFLGPGLPALYIDPTVWMWRVTCGVGAYVREGLELTSSNPVEVLPYGSLFRVTRKMINQMGLMRLRIHAVVDDEDTSHVVEGWISENLNPMSGQHGPIAQPVPFPVAALYKVILSQGAVIRSGIELSSSQVGHAAEGTILSVVGRAFSEHPQDKCIERLRLAGNGGWISIRLCEEPPNDDMVVQLIGIDGSFDPSSPGTFHLDAQQRVEEQVADSSMDEQSNIRGFEEIRRGELSEIGDSSDSSNTTTSKRKTKGGITRRRPPPSKRHNDVCLICLTEERTATIVHGETGHICCCLQCARILKQKGDRCPVCRLPIQLVIQHFHA